MDHEIPPPGAPNNGFVESARFCDLPIERRHSPECLSSTPPQDNRNFIFDYATIVFEGLDRGRYHAVARAALKSKEDPDRGLERCTELLVTTAGWH